MKKCVVSGKCLQPIEYKVLVLPDLIEETDETVKRFKALGMELPEKEMEREKYKQVTGKLICVGGKAFCDFGDPSPSVGDDVYFAKYAGQIIKSDDGTEFRLMSDKDITAIASNQT